MQTLVIVFAGGADKIHIAPMALKSGLSAVDRAGLSGGAAACYTGFGGYFIALELLALDYVDRAVALAAPNAVERLGGCSANVAKRDGGGGLEVAVIAV